MSWSIGILGAGSNIFFNPVQNVKLASFYTTHSMKFATFLYILCPIVIAPRASAPVFLFF